LNVFRSGEHIYAQVIDDTTGTTLVAASSLDDSLRNFKVEQPNPLLEAVGGAAQAVVGAVA
jgi:large subunit ribosomal protein L18